MATITGDAPPFYPPTVVPPPRPLPPWKFFPLFVRNPLLVLPKAVYEEPLLHYATRANRICYVSDPDLVKAVLLDQREAFPKTPIEKRVLGTFLGDGILTTDGADWRWQRQTLAPLFRPADMLLFVPDMAAAAEGALARWRAAPAGRVHALDRDMTDVTYDVIARTLIPGGSDALRQAIARASDDLLRQISWPIALAMLNAPDWVPFPGKARMQRANENMRARVSELIATRRAEAAGRNDILARLVRARHPETGEAMSDTQIVDNVVTFLAAGHETTAKALTWTLYLLACSPAWVGRLDDEIRRVAGSEPVAAEHIDQLVLHTQVVKEAMRLYPPAPVLTRIAQGDVTLGSQRITAGTLMVMSIFAIHRHRRRWEDADRFDPARFAPDREAQILRYQYMPFGAGPRVCIGSAFAMIEAVALLATFLRSARFHAPAGFTTMPVSRVTLRPRNGMPMHVTMRERA